MLSTTGLPLPEKLLRRATAGEGAARRCLSRTPPSSSTPVTPPATHCSLTQLPVMRTHTPSHTHAPGSRSKCPPSPRLLQRRGEEMAGSVVGRQDALQNGRQLLFCSFRVSSLAPCQPHTHNRSAVCIRLYILKGIHYCVYRQTRQELAQGTSVQT